MIRLNDIQDTDLGFRVLKDYKDPQFETIDKTIRIPGKDGAYYFGNDLAEKVFYLPVFFERQATKTDLKSKIQALKEIFFDANGKTKAFKLSFDDEPEKYYMVRYTGWMTIEKIATMGISNFRLTAYDPHAYADLTAYDPEETYEYDTGLQYDSGLMYDNPQGFQWTYSKHYSSAHNHSYYNTGLKLMIEGDVINPRITNLTTGESLTISGKYTSNERIYIDADKLLLFKVDLSIEGNYFLSPNFIYQHKKEISKGNLFSKYNGNLEKLNLVPGDNGLLFQGGLPNASVTYYWKHKFL